MKLVPRLGFFGLPDKFSCSLLSGLALIAGGMLYISFRSADIVLFRWIRFVGLDSSLTSFRERSLAYLHLMPPWIVYSLPNGLWAFAYTLIVLTIWAGSHSWLRYLWYATVPLLVFGFEGLQLTGMIRGTFCYIDLAFGAAGILAGLLINHFNYKRRIEQ